MTTSRNKTKKKSDLHTSTCLAKNTKISIDNNEINEMYYTHHSAPIGCAHTRVWVQIDWVFEFYFRSISYGLD